MSYSILHIAPENFAGVPIDFKRMHEHFGNSSRLITFHDNPLGFEEDICCHFAIPRSKAATFYRMHPNHTVESMILPLKFLTVFAMKNTIVQQLISVSKRDHHPYLYPF